MASENASVAGRLDIRKYPNRRYYDSTRSRHVTLEEIQTLIRDGHEVCVTDSRTGQDITGKVLTQIILELDTPKLEIFPTPLLHRLIRANEKLVNDFVEKYFNRALSAFLDSQRQFESYMRQTLGLPAGPDWARLMGPFAPQFWAPGGGPGPSAAGPPAKAAPTEELGAVVEELRRELASLRKRVNGKGRPTGRRRK